jgi:hypothetical protein
MMLSRCLITNWMILTALPLLYTAQLQPILTSAYPWSKLGKWHNGVPRPEPEGHAGHIYRSHASPPATSGHNGKQATYCVRAFRLLKCHIGSEIEVAACCRATPISSLLKASLTWKSQIDPFTIWNNVGSNLGYTLDDLPRRFITAMVLHRSAII